MVSTLWHWNNILCYLHHITLNVITLEIIHWKVALLSHRVPRHAELPLDDPSGISKNAANEESVKDTSTTSKDDPGTSEVSGGLHGDSEEGILYITRTTMGWTCIAVFSIVLYFLMELSLMELFLLESRGFNVTVLPPHTVSPSKESIVPLYQYTYIQCTY